MLLPAALAAFGVLGYSACILQSRRNRQLRRLLHKVVEKNKDELALTREQVMKADSRSMQLAEQAQHLKEQIELEENAHDRLQRQLTSVNAALQGMEDEARALAARSTEQRTRNRDMRRCFKQDQRLMRHALQVKDAKMKQLLSKVSEHTDTTQHPYGRMVPLQLDQASSPEVSKSTADTPCT